MADENISQADQSANNTAAASAQSAASNQTAESAQAADSTSTSKNADKTADTAETKIVTGDDSPDIDETVKAVHAAEQRAEKAANAEDLIKDEDLQEGELNSHHATDHYGAKDLKVLEGLQAVRLCPGMYIGSTGPRGLHHLVYEIVDNSVDEALAGYATHIEVTILADGGVRVTDDGRGIPVDTVAATGKSGVETVMTKLHAGGKFGGGGYFVSGGLHGVGISVVNALSTHMDIVVHRQGYEWTQHYVNQKPTAPLARGKKIADDDTGTTVTFWADPSIFETTDYDFETLRTRFQQTAFLNKGLRITLTDLCVPEDSAETPDEDGESSNKVSYCFKNGVTDYVRHLVTSRRSTPIVDDIVSFAAEDMKLGISADVAMQWTAGYSETLRTFANTISTTVGGTHEEGFKAALTGLINRYARDKKLLKDSEENLTGEDCREGLVCVLSVKLTEPQFEGQTKTKLGNPAAKTFVQRIVTDHLADWFDAHPTQAKRIVEKAIDASHSRLAAKKARETTRRKSLFESAGMPDKLKDCQSNNPAECELFIVEGDSAGGSAIQGRDPNIQAILPLRGKILNTERASFGRMMKSDTIDALITAVGAGYGDSFDISKARYHKIIIMADADVDGAHIATLILTLFFRYMRPMIEAGYVYVAMPPLYRIKWSKGPHDFVYTDGQRDEALAKGKAEGRTLPKGEGIQRYKGLGEMSYQELWETTMDPDTRIVKQIHLDDAEQANATFSMLMGDEVGPRRMFIERNAKDVKFIDA